MLSISQPLITPRTFKPLSHSYSISHSYPVSHLELPVEDGEPMETPQHLKNMNVLIDSLHEAWATREDVYIGGNMFVYFSPDQVKTKDYRGPDFFVVQNTTKNVDRQAWVVWEERGRTPDMVVELLSKTTKEFDLKGKKAIYQNILKTPDYFVFDPLEPQSSLQGWHLVDHRYQKLLPNDQGWLWCDSLGLWLGTWKGTIKHDYREWLRFFDSHGRMLQLPEEAALQQVALQQSQKEEAFRQADEALQQATQDRQRLEQLMERLQARGIKVEEL